MHQKLQGKDCTYGCILTRNMRTSTIHKVPSLYVPEKTDPGRREECK
jgi:hypothetical protein